jgi:Arc/MetJ family transcription regulator
MRTNIDIDDDLLVKAMQAGPYTTKKETVEAACACWHARPPTAKSSSGKASSGRRRSHRLDQARRRSGGEPARLLTVQEPQPTYPVTCTRAKPAPTNKATRRAGR